ncbi:MAG: hypothetical protein P1V20_06560 [Verrucomicrobiales bacterium]|nr:hypothetical protein [Verrucomicrobiales bacterium]
MKSSFAILLIPALIPILCAFHTAVVKTSYDLQSNYNKRQIDVVLRNGNLQLTSFRHTDSFDTFKFRLTPDWDQAAPVHLLSLLGSPPALQLIETGPNTVALPGTKIIIAQLPVWMISVILLIPAVVFGRRHRKKMQAEFRRRRRN